MQETFQEDFKNIKSNSNILLLLKLVQMILANPAALVDGPVFRRRENGRTCIKKNKFCCEIFYSVLALGSE